MLANIPATQTVIEITAPGGPEMLVPAPARFQSRRRVRC
jgi:hypothetical protein